MRVRAAAAVVLAAAAAALCPAPASAAAPWREAEQLRSALFDAQASLIIGGRSEIAKARGRALGGSLGRGLREGAPAELRELRAALAAAERATASENDVALAAARGRALAALRRGSYRVTLNATRQGDAARASEWLLIRDFRQATRFTRPGVDATAALDRLQAGEIEPEAAATEVRKDLLDAYQARTLSVLAEAEQAKKRGFAAARAEYLSLAAGLWPLLEPEYLRQRGPAAGRLLDKAFEAGSTAAIRAGLDGFTAAAFSDEEQARRAGQLIRFIDLIPVEYDHGTDDGHVTIPFELQEALAFLDGADASFADLKGELQRREPAAVAEIEAGLVEMRRFVTDANEGGEVVSLDEIESAHGAASGALDRILPEEWKQSSDEADFELITISLDQMQAALGAGEYERAEQARLAAYAFLDFGPELKLKAFDNQLATELEGLFWYGAAGNDGLAQLIGERAPVSEVRETRVVVDEDLDRARKTLGDGASAGTAITNSALIVFREGLEAILILAAITASLLGTRRRLRKPILRGALIAIPASILLWVLAQTLLDSLSRYGEKLEAVVGLIAIAVLLLVLNWFFHKVYWTEWIKGHRARGNRLAEGAGAAVGASATVLGLYLLGFSSVLREGFETVLFLQALQLSSGTGVVVAGVSLGLAVTMVVGVATLKLEQRLPYKRLLVVTGVLIALVLVTMVGNTVRVMQAVSWMPITPVDVELPLWMGSWLGIFPTLETLGAQGAALGFVIGSYYLAEWVRKRHVRAALAASVPEPAIVVGPPGNGNGDANGAAAPRPAPRVRSGSSSEA